MFQLIKNNTNHYKRLLKFYNDITVKVVKKEKKRMKSMVHSLEDVLQVLGIRNLNLVFLPQHFL